MNVLSLFDGKSCGQIALIELGIIPDIYYASEIDKHAMKQTQLNFPNTIQLGDVSKWREWNIDFGGIDLLLAGSPCQGFSFAGKQLAFNDPRSKLFFVFVDILNHIRKLNPDVKFLLENVNMKKEHQAVINEYCGLMPIRINSSLVSAQNRDRFYWSNIRTKEVGLFGEVYTDIPQPKDKGIMLKDILDSGIPCNTIMEKSKTLLKTYSGVNSTNILRGAHFGASGSAEPVCVNGKSGTDNSQPSRADRIYDVNAKAVSVTTGFRPSIAEPIIYQRGKGFNKGGTHCDKSPTVTSNGWQDNNHVIEPMEMPCRKETDIIVNDTGIRCQMRDKKKSTAAETKVQFPNNKADTLITAHVPKVIEPAKNEKRIYTVYKGLITIKDKTYPINLPDGDYVIRKLTVSECARLQTIPDWYKWECSDTQAYRMLGNGWTIDVITHILSFMDTIKKT